MKRATSTRKTEPRARRGAAHRMGPAPPVPVHLERSQGDFLHRQVYRELAQLICGRRLRPGTRLPSSRSLAEELGVSRNTVLLALEQLMSEGYLETRRGHGTYVAVELPDAAPLRVDAPTEKKTRLPLISPRAHSLIAPTHLPVTTSGLLRPGEPDCTEFPFKLWARLLWESWRRPSRALLFAEDPTGYPPLRTAIADYLVATRGVTCSAENIVIVSGIRQALTVAARLLLDPDDAVWLEDPGYPPLRGPLVAARAKLIPVECECRGLSVHAGRQTSAHPKLICIVPSHQYPLSMAMSGAPTPRDSGLCATGECLDL